jgi:hypothetical protein
MQLKTFEHIKKLEDRRENIVNLQLRIIKLSTNIGEKNIMTLLATIDKQIFKKIVLLLVSLVILVLLAMFGEEVARRTNNPSQGKVRERELLEEINRISMKENKSIYHKVNGNAKVKRVTNNVMTGQAKSSRGPDCTQVECI